MFWSVQTAPIAGAGVTGNQYAKTSVCFFCSAITRRGARPRRLKRLFGAHAHDLRMIVVFAQMAQDQRLHAAIEIVFHVIAGDRVREMAVAPHHALLDAPGIRPHLQHLQIVIRFEQQNLHAAQMHLDGIGHIAEIGCDADLDAFGVEAETHRIDGVVRDGETLHHDIADHPAGTGLKLLHRAEAVSKPSHSMVGAVSREMNTATGLFCLRAPANKARQAQPRDRSAHG